jgi:hypothetical protein
MVVENKSGASGVLAAREVARGKPDGHTLLFINSGIVAVTPHVQKDAGFDGVKDFAPVALATTAPLFVIVPGNLPVNDLKASSTGRRSSRGRLATPRRAWAASVTCPANCSLKAAGLKMTHVPYRGQAPTTTAVLTGEVSLLITSMSSAMRGFIDERQAQAAGRDLGRTPSAARPRRAHSGQRAAGLCRRDLVRLGHHRRHAAGDRQPLNSEINTILATQGHAGAHGRAGPAGARHDAGTAGRADRRRLGPLGSGGARQQHQQQITRSPLP